MTTIRVVNNSEAVLRGRYDGEDYEFPVGEPVDLPMEAAVHIFDFGRDDKRAALNRLNWFGPTDKYEEAVKKLDSIKFLEGKMTFEDQASEAVDAPRGKRTGNARPHVKPSGEPGGEVSSPPGDSFPE